ncbi:MAG: universal stress protein [Planctomycetota bacterium]
MRIDRILVPSDLSATAAEALPPALELARRYGAAIRLVHVLEPIAAPFAEIYAYGSTNAPERDFQARVLEAEGALLKLVAVTPNPHGVKVETRVVGGLVGFEIGEQAKECELIVMSTFGNTGLNRLLLGSIAERVVRLSNVPVLTIRPGARPEAVGLGTVKRVLFPVDLTVQSFAAAPVARELANRFGAELDLLCVGIDPHAIPVSGFVQDYLPGDFYQNAELRTITKMRELAAPNGITPGHGTRFFVRFGTAYKEIVAHATEAPCELIVMSTHGRTGVPRWVIGSVAERVVRLAPCPVLTVRVEHATA